MFLKQLIIRKDGEVIRDINFKMGVNLIVDNTPITGGKESGNNVGKTTVLRLVDYCLGSTGNDIYYDTEFKTSKNSDLRNYLIDNNFEVELALFDNLNEPTHSVHICRNFKVKNHKLITINNDKVTIEQHIDFLKSELFNYSSQKPSFRGLLGKFIRDSTIKMSKTLRYLHPTTTLIEYEAIHLFLLGIHLGDDLLQEKQWLNSKINVEQTVLTRITEDFTENALVQALKIIERDISELETTKSKFNINQTEIDQVEKLNNLKKEISSEYVKYGNVKSRLDLISQSINELKQGIKQYDVDQIRTIYNNANALIPNIQVKFEEVVSFHNSMLLNKLSYIEKEAEPQLLLYKQLEAHIKDKLKVEKDLSDKLKSYINLNEYNTTIKELNSKYELKGNKEERLTQIKALKGSLNEKKGRLSEINESMQKSEEALSLNEELFNKYFSAYSKELYGEEYFLTHEKNHDDIFVFEIANIQANVGGGKKKGQIASFDLAYLSFIEESKLHAPNFQMHDSLEDVSINQLISISNISSRINGQYILSVLKDKFSGYPEGEKIIEDNTILELSQEKKLFMFK